MQKIVWLMLGFLGIAGSLYAQDNNKQRPARELFELPPYSLEEVFRFDLQKNNQLLLELGSVQDLQHWTNLDSVLQVFINDMKAFRDSFADPATTKHIDYVIDLSGRKKIRIRQTRTTGSTFLLDHGEPALLKLEQDTIRIIAMHPFPDGVRYDRLCLFINQYDELGSFLNKELNKKIQELQQNTNDKNYYTRDKWTLQKGIFYLNTDPSIAKMRMPPADLAKFSRSTLQIAAFARVNAQNYKNYFSPSFSPGLSLSVSVSGNRHTLNTTWEPMFFFPTNPQGQTQTLHNDFLVFSYMYTKAKRPDEAAFNKQTGIYAAFSFGWLVNREGDLFPKHSYRISAARFNLLRGNIFLEPCMYFHEFFREVTPGIRISVGGILY